MSDFKITFESTPHGTVHAVGHGNADDYTKIRRSIASRAGRLSHVGHRITEGASFLRNGRAVEVRVIYSEVKGS